MKKILLIIAYINFMLIELLSIFNATTFNNTASAIGTVLIQTILNLQLLILVVYGIKNIRKIASEIRNLCE
jgi:hypothetical protein